MNTRAWMLIVTVFLGFLGISLPYLLFPSLFLLPEYAIVPADWSVETRGIYLGVTLGAYPLGQFFGSPILGALSDEYGRRKILSRSLAAAALFSLVSAAALLCQSVWLLILGRFLMGFMEGNIAIARAMAADMKEVSKQKLFGYINASASLAYLLGPFVGVLLFEIGLATPFFVIALFFFGLSLFTLFIPSDQQMLTTWHKSRLLERLNLSRLIRGVIQDPKLKFLFLVVSLHTLAADMFYQFGPVYLTEKWNLSPSSLTLYNGILCLALFLGNGFLAAALTRRYSSARVIVGSMALLTTSFIGLALAQTSALMLLFFALAGIGVSMAVTNLTVEISNTASERVQGEVMGVQLSLRVLGDAAICLVGGLFVSLSSSLMLVAASIVSFIALAYYRKKSVFTLKT